MKMYKIDHTNMEFLVSEEFQMRIVNDDDYVYVELNPNNFEDPHFLKTHCTEVRIDKARVFALFRENRKLLFEIAEEAQQKYMKVAQLDNRLEDFDWEGYL